MKTEVTFTVQNEPIEIAAASASGVIRITHDAQLPALSRNLAPNSTDLRCPHCDSIIYSRRHKLCGVCAEELPTEVLFTEGESAHIKGLLREEQHRHRCWMTKSFRGTEPVALLAS